MQIPRPQSLTISAQQVRQVVRVQPAGVIPWRLVADDVDRVLSRLYAWEQACPE